MCTIVVVVMFKKKLILKIYTEIFTEEMIIQDLLQNNMGQEYAQEQKMKCY